MSTSSGDVTDEVQESTKALACGTARQQVQASWEDESSAWWGTAAVRLVVMRLGVMRLSTAS